MKNNHYLHKHLKIDWLRETESYAEMLVTIQTIQYSISMQF